MADPPVASDAGPSRHGRVAGRAGRVLGGRAGQRDGGAGGAGRQQQVEEQPQVAALAGGARHAGHHGGRGAGRAGRVLFGGVAGGRGGEQEPADAGRGGGQFRGGGRGQMQQPVAAGGAGRAAGRVLGRGGEGPADAGHAGRVLGRGPGRGHPIQQEPAQGGAGQALAGRGRGAGGRGGNYVAAAIPPITPAEILQRGLALIGFPAPQQGSARTLARRFRGGFGPSSEALASLYNDLKQNIALLDERTANDLVPIKQKTSSINLKDYLIAMHWLKTYDLESNLAGRFGYNEKTIRIKTRAYTRWVQVMIEVKVVFDNAIPDEDIGFIISVDGVHCTIFEPRKQPGTQWYLHKHNGPALTYELAIAIHGNGGCVNVRGPFPAAQHDITTFRGGRKMEDKDPDALQFKIAEDQRAIGDSGYRGEPNKITVTRPEDSAELKNFKARVKARHETFNSRIKAYNILSTRFRHRLTTDPESEDFLSQHKRAFEAVIVAVQYDLENGHALFDV